jgi:hypothetical protein
MRRRLIKAAFLPIIVSTAILGAGGCEKKAAQQVASQPAPATTAQPSAQLTAPVQTSAQPVPQNSEPDLAQINRTLIRWIIGHKRRPANFEDFAATADAPIPPAPAGKRYVLGANMHVQLVNQ